MSVASGELLVVRTEAVVEACGPVVFPGIRSRVVCTEGGLGGHWVIVHSRHSAGAG